MTDLLMIFGGLVLFWLPVAIFSRRMPEHYRLEMIGNIVLAALGVVGLGIAAWLVSIPLAWLFGLH